MVLLKKRDYGFSVVLVAPPRRSNQFNLHTMVIPTFKTFRKVKKINRLFEDNRKIFKQELIIEVV